MKIFLRDEYENAYIQEESVVTDVITTTIKYGGKDNVLTITRLFAGKANSAHSYKIVMPATLYSSWSIIIEGAYSIQLVTKTIGNLTFPIYVQSLKNSTAYPSVVSTLSVKYKSPSLALSAGNFMPWTFSAFD